MDQVRLVIHVSTQFENCVELADEILNRSSSGRSHLGVPVDGCFWIK